MDTCHSIVTSLVSSRRRTFVKEYRWFLGRVIAASVKEEQNKWDILKPSTGVVT